MLHSRAALIFALAATNVALAENTPGAAIKVSSSSQVCSTSGCLQGKSSSPLLAHDPSANKYLLPGTYTTTTGLSPVSSLNATITHSPSDLDTVVISPPSFPVAFTSPSYAGSPSTWEEGGWETKNWRSVFLPDDWYAILDGGNVVWGAVPEKMGWPDSIANSNIVRAASSTCNPTCSSHGTCTFTNSSTSSATCACATGWTGPSCDSCAPGFWGPSCIPCVSNCTICDDGFLGTGACLGTSTSSQTTCDCQHGTCTSASGCICSAGWTTNSTTSSSKCNVCAEGFFQDSTGNCLACPLGCESCELQSGTNSTATCLSCSANLSLSSSKPATCSSSTESCSDGTYYDSSSSSCKSCSPACSTCTGPSTSDCLACASPRVNLQGSCVGYDATTGVCDSSLSQLQGVFVVNNAKSECDACPVGCLNCHIPSFSSVADYDTLTCSASALMGGSCLLALPILTGPVKSAIHRAVPAYHQPRPVLHVRLRPPSPLSALASPHVHHRRSLRTEHVYYVHPIAHHVPHQQPAPHVPPLDLYYPVTDDVPTSVLLLIRDDSKSCTACPDGFTLKEGTCYALSCNQGGFASGLGICLSDLVQSSFNKSYLGFIAFLALIIPGGVGIWWYIRRERRQTREDTKQFGERLDSKAVKDRLDVLRLESVLGLNRLRCGSGRNGGVDEEGKYDEGRRMRFRNLLLPSKRNRQANNDVELSSKSHHDRQRAGWSVPPPPYVPSLTSPPHSSESDTKTQHAEWSSGLTAPRGLRDSLDSIPTPVLAGFSASQPSTAAQEAERQRPSSTYMLGNTIVHSLSTGPSSSLEPAVQPTPTFGGLLPPPRPGMVRQSSMPSKEREVSRLTTGAEDGMGVERRLRDLWPALNDGSGRREEEGYI
ncbi:hypothetical protein CI109_101491 [Kwoniella shandongensis]|uniref:EGF-like domain-containing protein n=1 Tax=Kwoniella shandongensis TaxID=1734106 RepID=A0AAJ8LH55_9TREE